MHQIIIQIAADGDHIPKAALLRKWARQALKQRMETAEVTIRIVDVDEMTALNTTYRQKQGPTNVLSFPFLISEEEVELDIPLLGDIVICADVVKREAQEQAKPVDAHWAHMVVHGVFHLLGYDHENDADADVMETLESKTMQLLGYPDPYQHGDSIKHHE